MFKKRLFEITRMEIILKGRVFFLFWMNIFSRLKVPATLLLLFGVV